MDLDRELSARIVLAAEKYVGKAYDWHTFDCVHFVLSVFQDVGIALPRLSGQWEPPPEFHLSEQELEAMPLGHSVFLKRKASTANKIWTHVAIIVSRDELIHCSRHFGRQVTITPKAELLEIYTVVPKPPR